MSAGAIQCTQCKGTGVNSVDHFNGQFKAGGLCWLCRYLTNFEMLNNFLNIHSQYLPLNLVVKTFVPTRGLPMLWLAHAIGINNKYEH